MSDEVLLGLALIASGTALIIAGHDEGFWAFVALIWIALA